MKQWTVKELVEFLSNFPSDLRVLVDGYEGGYEDIVIRHKQVQKSGDESDYYGEYDNWYEGDVTECSPPFEALVLHRS